MKKYFLLLALLPLFCFAQNPNPDNVITVIGISELEIEPDLITISMTARESENVKKESDLVLMENKILRFISGLGIKNENFIIDRYSANEKFAVSSGSKFKLFKSYKIIIPSASLLDTIVTKCFEAGMQNIYVSKIDHSQIDNLRNDLLAKALISAKEKAEIISKTMGISLGKVSMVNESYKLVSNRQDSYNNDLYALDEVVLMGYTSGYSKSTRTGSTITLEKLHLSKTVIVKYTIE
jgi:uncharacterized protein